ncbi:MAG: lactate utilization protein [Candidatus Aenigmarchaeota archaeon]|nr:lactate utilization protein [Candidatus Aenigmarchaeota archaeon]
MAFDKLGSDESIEKAVASLKANGIEAFVVENGEQAKQKALEMIPEGAEVMNMTSVTLDAIGLTEEIMSGRNSVRKKLMSMDRTKHGSEMKKLGIAPDYAVGSVHAITEDGKVLIASASGSQLPAYAYGAGKVIWIAGTQKIVKNLEEGMKRIYEYTLPLEDQRARIAYGVGSGVNKLLVVNKEFAPGRITLILVKEKLGF